MNKSIIYLIIAIVLVSCVSAIGISPTKQTLKYALQPENYSFTITTDGSQGSLTISTSGELSDYIKIQKIIDINGKTSVTIPYTVTLNSTLEPGLHKGKIIVNQMSEGQSTITTGFQLTLNLEAFIAYNGKHIETATYVSELENKAMFIIFVKNRGKEDIKNVSAEIKIKQDDETVETLKTNTDNLPYQGTARLIALWQPAQEGGFTAEVTTNYDGKKETTTKDFKIGSNFISVNQIKISTKSIKISMENELNNVVKNVYAEIVFKDKNNQIIEKIDTEKVLLKPMSNSIIENNISLKSLAETIDVTIKQEGKDYVLFHKIFKKKRTLFSSPGQILTLITIILLLIAVALFLAIKNRNQRKNKKQKK